MNSRKKGSGKSGRKSYPRDEVILFVVNHGTSKHWILKREAPLSISSVRLNIVHTSAERHINALKRKGVAFQAFMKIVWISVTSYLEFLVLPNSYPKYYSTRCPTPLEFSLDQQYSAFWERESRLRESLRTEQENWIHHNCMAGQGTRLVLSVLRWALRALIDVDIWWPLPTRSSHFMHRWEDCTYWGDWWGLELNYI